MSKADEVREILEAHDGAMKQYEIRDETGWAASTLTQVLQRMDEDGEVVRIKLGRSKQVYLDGHVPEMIADD